VSTKDYITLVISGLALAVSIVSAVIGQIQTNRQKRTGIREQLSSVVQNLISCRADYDTLNAEPVEKRDEAKIATVNHKLTSLARQACALEKMEQDVGFDVEFIAIANALTISGDIAGAEEYYEKAVSKSPSPYYKSINMILYGRFLFEEAQYEKGRRVFAEAVSALPNTSDLNRWAIARAYRMWIESEVWSGSESNKGVDKHYQTARGLLQSISSKFMREAGLRELEDLATRLPSYKSSALPEEGSS
jgi:tetratricopeptide (TPR) repeat protein